MHVKRGCETALVAAFVSTASPVEVAPELFWTRALSDSLRGGSGPTSKDDLERGSLSVPFSNLM